MKRTLLLLGIWLSGQTVILAQEPILSDSLPDPLITQSGKVIGTKEEWIATRRPELLRLFQETIYGALPTATIKHSRQRIISHTACRGRATLTEVTLFFGKEAPCRQFCFSVVLPHSEGKVPMIVGLNYSGTNHVLSPDIVNQESTKGWNEYPVEEIINRGYGLATCYYQDILPDNAGAVSLYRQAVATAGYSPGAISVWAWGLMQMMDYLQHQDGVIYNNKVAVYGFSRLGKAAIWAGVNDERFAAVISNASGCGGAGLFRHRTYESIAKVNKRFAYWFTDTFVQYSDRESALLIDQHELLALIAPRFLYIGNALNDQYVEPFGEFEAARRAAPVYELFGLKGIPVEVPQVEVSYSDNSIGYHMRKGKHDITDFDWNNYLLFLDKKLKTNY